MSDELTEIENLREVVDQGFALTAEEGALLLAELDRKEDAVGDLTRAELLAALKVEHKQAKEQAEESEIDRFGAMAVNRMIVRERDEARAELKKLVVSFRAANEAHNQLAAKYDALAAEVRENLSLRDGVVTAWMGELGATLVPAIAAVLQATELQEARP